MSQSRTRALPRRTDIIRSHTPYKDTHTHQSPSKDKGNKGKVPESMTNKSFFRLSLTSPPKIYTSPSLPAETFAACENRGNGFAFRNLRIDHGEELGPDEPPLPPVIVLGESGGELTPFAAFTDIAEGGI